MQHLWRPRVKRCGRIGASTFGRRFGGENDPCFHSAALRSGLPAVATAIVIVSVGLRTIEPWRIADGGDVTGSTGNAGRLPLSDEQRGHVFDGIMKMRAAPVADVTEPELARKLSIELQELPASVTQNVPVCAGLQVRQARRPHSAGQPARSHRGRRDTALSAHRGLRNSDHRQRLSPA